MRMNLHTVFDDPGSAAYDMAYVAAGRYDGFGMNMLRWRPGRCRRRGAFTDS